MSWHDSVRQVDEREKPRSALWMPLVVGGKGKGWISLQNLDREHAFSDSDVQLLGTLAGSLSVALENARLVHETRQRIAELAVINSVQESIAGELDPQAIYDLVGEKLREVFDAQVVDIAIHDADAGLMRFVYQIERGVHFPNITFPVMGFRKHVMDTREPLAVDENMDAALVEYGNPAAVAGEPSNGSAIFQPLVVGGRATGAISVQNLDREHAFSPSDQQLLATIAGSLGVALENAQLIHETRQRVAELGTVNSVGQALASQLDLDALIGLVGERVRETFDADIAYVALHDEAAGVIEFPYTWELGERRRRAADAVRRGPDLADHRVGRAAPASTPPLRDDRPVDRDSGEVVPRRADLGRRQGNRGDQRPEHPRGRPVRRGGHATTRDARGKRRSRDRERAVVRGDRAAEAVLRIAGRDQPGGGDRDGRGGAGHRLEPGRRRAVRLLA